MTERLPLETISAYNPLRTVHPLKVREIPSVNRGHYINGGPIEPLFRKKSSIVVGVIDGGIHEENPYLENYSDSEFVVSGNPIAQYKDHGTQVAGAVLYGALNDIKFGARLGEPNISIKSFGVLSDSIVDIDLYEVIDAMESFVPKNPEIKVYNLSLGPNGPIFDDNISRFTYSCDLLSYTHEILFCVAVGNDGEVLGYDRIQSPSDSVNCLGVGAYTKVDGKKVRAPYSCVGPGREGGKMKPDVMAFGGCQQYPIHLIGNNTGEKVWNLGTSFSSPIVAGIAGRLIGESKDIIHPLTAKALIIHSAEHELNHHCFEMGHGAVLPTTAQITECKENSYTLIYTGEIEPGKYAEYLIPWENIKHGKAIFKWTTVVLTDVDQLSTDDYTSSSVEVTFYPNRNKFSFKNVAERPLDGRIKKSEIVDVELDPDRAQYLIDNGWEQSNFPVTSSPSTPYKKEEQLRADLKWDSLDKREISKLANTISEPVFHVHALSRGTRCDLKKVKFSLVLTVITPSADIDLYDTILNKYSALIPLEVNVEAEVEVSNDIRDN